MSNSINENRCLWLDYLKVFLAFVIVMQHSISPSWTSLPTESIEWQIINIFFLFSKTAVPLFVMCSGIGMLSKERTIFTIWRKNIFHLLKAYICWMIVYGIYDLISLYTSGYTEARLYINALLKSVLFGRYHTWFIIMLLGLYMITPLLSAITQKKEHLQYFIVLSVIFTTILPIIQHFSQLSRLYDVIQNIHMNFVVGYSMYYLLGYYIFNYVPIKPFKHPTAFFLIIFAGACFISSYLSVQTKIPNQEIFIDFSFIAVILNCLLMVLFRQLFEDPKSRIHFTGRLASLSKYGIVIYIIHPLFLWIIPEHADLMSLFYAVLIWIIALLVSIIIKKIPLINKFLFI